MKFTYDDLTDSHTLIFKIMKQLTDEAERLEERAKRIRRLDRSLTYLIQRGKITDTTDIDCAFAWLNHSNLTAGEIIDKIME
jgi:hypothetical protein